MFKYSAQSGHLGAGRMRGLGEDDIRTRHDGMEKGI